MPSTDNGRKYWNFTHTVEDFKDIAEDTTVIVADVETTGLDPLRPGIQIVEVAAAAYNLEDGIEDACDPVLQPIDLYHVYIELNEPALFWQHLENNGHVKIHEEKPDRTKEMTFDEVLVMNKYLSNKVDVVSSKEGLTGVKNFIEKFARVTLCGHNLNFDLNQICRVIGPIRHLTTLDTMDIAWHYLIPLIDAAYEGKVNTRTVNAWYGLGKYPDHPFDPCRYMYDILQRHWDPNGWPIGKGMISSCKLHRLGDAFCVPNTAAHSGRADVEQTAGIFFRMVHYLNMNAHLFDHPDVRRRKAELSAYWRIRHTLPDKIVERKYVRTSRARKIQEFNSAYT
jgi:hypothetical protein